MGDRSCDKGSGSMLSVGRDPFESDSSAKKKKGDDRDKRQEYRSVKKFSTWPVGDEHDEQKDGHVPQM